MAVPARTPTSVPWRAPWKARSRAARRRPPRRVCASCARCASRHPHPGPEVWAHPYRRFRCALDRPRTRVLGCTPARTRRPYRRREASVPRSGPQLPQRIAHFDLDSFFVAVERVDDPALRGLPVLVGGRGGRGVVASASYEARRFGCHSAQPMAQALRLCPQAVVMPPRFERYRAVSRAFHAILRDVSPVVESGGIDEAYVDLTGVGLDAGGALAAAQRARKRVHGELGVSVSACIAGSRTVAKVGSDRAKPDGLIELPPGGDAAFLAPLPVRDLPMVGPKLAERLHAVGVRTIGEAAALDARWLEARFGQSGLLLHERARGIDPTPVHAGGRDVKSVSREVTFGTDVTELDELRRALHRHAERVGADLRHAGRRARTVTLKLRWSDFETVTRSRTLERPCESTAALAQAGCALLDMLWRGSGRRPVRLIGLGASNLVEDSVQLGFADLAAGERAATRRSPLRDERLDRAVDAIRARFGEDALSRGA
ncbi:MAG: DNA polymerase IV [Dehalococcoidia bacterium]|nr:DNA polymerase IV [Dehalococcoidia bacterium]